jgi:hypothetical protein
MHYSTPVIIAAVRYSDLLNDQPPNHIEQSPWADSEDIPALHGVRSSVAVFARPCGWPISWQLYQSTTCFPPALRSDFLRYSKRSSSLSVSHYNSIRIYLLSHACHVPRLSCRPRPYDFKNVWLKVQIIKLLVTQFSLASLYFILDPNIFLRDSLLAHSHSMFCFPIWDHVSHPYKITIQL